MGNIFLYSIKTPYTLTLIHKKIIQLDNDNKDNGMIGVMDTGNERSSSVRRKSKSPGTPGLVII